MQPPFDEPRLITPLGKIEDALKIYPFVQNPFLVRRKQIAGVIPGGGCGSVLDDLTQISEELVEPGLGPFP
jgi:hypothetical protein